MLNRCSSDKLFLVDVVIIDLNYRCHCIRNSKYAYNIYGVLAVFLSSEE